MKKHTQLLVFFGIVIGIAISIFCVKYLMKGYNTYIYRELKINKNNGIVLYENDTHGGFFGEGTYCITLDCSDKYKKLEKTINNWQKLPLPENLNLIMYGGVRDGKTYGYNLADKVNIPKVENGYYYFLNRHSDASDKYSDMDLFDLYSFNFSLAIYDSDKKLLYYVREDT